MISLMTGTMASIRQIQVSVPILQDNGVKFEEAEALMPNLILLKKILEDRLDHT